jgi:hypothetical protein
MPEYVKQDFCCEENPNLIITNLPKSFKVFCCDYNQLFPCSKSNKIVYLYHESNN